MSFGDFGKDFTEYSAKSSLILSGNNVIPPSEYVADNEQRWMPKEETRDVFYDVLPRIASLSVSQRLRILRALVYSLLPSLEVMEFNDTTHFESFKFLEFLFDNPQYKAKGASSPEEMNQMLEPFTKRMVKKKMEEIEREKELKKILKKLGENKHQEDEDDDD